MAYREDQDLEFMAACSSEELDPLVAVLTKTGSGNERLTEGLTLEERYKEHSPDHERYWDLVAAELQYFGANTISTVFRGGKGVAYREVLTDVCRKVRVKDVDLDGPVVEIEWALLKKVFADMVEEMDAAELEGLVRDLDLGATDFTKEAVLAAIMSGVRGGGFLAYRVSVIVANAIARFVLGRGLSFAANAGLTRALAAFTGPPGWVFLTVVTALQVAGPAYRVTIPAVTLVACLRLWVEERQYDASRNVSGIDPKKRKLLTVAGDGQVAATKRRLGGDGICVVSRPQTKGVDFPSGTMVEGLVYAIHPRNDNRYLDVATFHKDVVLEQVFEAVELLRDMGATYVRVEMSKDASALLGGELGVRVGGGEANVKGEVEGDNKMSVVAERRYRPISKQIDGRVVERSVWYRHDPFFGQTLAERLSGSLEECKFERSIEDDFGIDASLDLSALEKVGLKIGGKFQSHVAGRWVVHAQF